MVLSFDSSFWTPDYGRGLEVLFNELRRGCAENKELIQLAIARTESEELYGENLKMLSVARGGQSGDGSKKRIDDSEGYEGASLRRAFDGVIKEMGEEGKHHKRVADNIRAMVIKPFSKWATDHEYRMNRSQDILTKKVKTHEKAASDVKRLQKVYFNKCRLMEDLEEEGNLAFQVPPLASVTGSKLRQTTPSTPGSDNGFTSIVPSTSSETASTAPTTVMTEEQENKDDDNNNNNNNNDDEDEPVEIGDEWYTREKLKDLISQMLQEVPQKEVKVPILGTYTNVSTGDQIVSWIQDNMNQNGVAGAEKIGQDLIDEGFLRLIGSVGKRFANSSIFNYQWRREAFKLADLQSLDQSKDLITPLMGEYIGGIVQSRMAHMDESPVQRAKREVQEADDKYQAAVKSLDDLRCDLEESIMEHCKFLERCEMDRLKAIKAVLLDFSASISNVLPSTQATVDNMLLYQETVNPNNDLRYMIESRQTGYYIPRVVPYDNYYSLADSQTFGISLELRSRGDHKKVPHIVSTILSYMDMQYPILENDKVRQSVWTIDVPLKATNALRREINTGQPFAYSILDKHQLPVVCSVLKQFFLELPDSLISSTVYDILRAIYASHSSEQDTKVRIPTIQNALGQLRINNIATLDALMTHYTRLMQLTNADDEYMSKLAHVLSPVLLRPRVLTSVTMANRHGYRLILDLFQHKSQIFSELKRANSRPRGVSTDESNRRANMEARQQRLTASIKSQPHHHQHNSQSQFTPELPSAPPALGSPSVGSGTPPPASANGGGLSLQFGTPQRRMRATSNASGDYEYGRPRSVGSPGSIPSANIYSGLKELKLSTSNDNYTMENDNNNGLRGLQASPFTSTNNNFQSNQDAYDDNVNGRVWTTTTQLDPADKSHNMSNDSRNSSTSGVAQPQSNGQYSWTTEEQFYNHNNNNDPQHVRERSLTSNTYAKRTESISQHDEGGGVHNPVLVDDDDE